MDSGSHQTGPRHDGGAYADAMRLLAARRELIKIVASHNLDVLQADLLKPPPCEVPWGWPQEDERRWSRPAPSCLSAFETAVTATMTRLVDPAGRAAPSMQVIRRLARRISKEKRTDENEVIDEAMKDWLAIWVGARVLSHKPPSPLHCRLYRVRDKLADGAPTPSAVLRNQIETALRDQGGLDGSISPHHLRAWTTLQRYSAEVMPKTPNERHGERCSIVHWEEIIRHIPDSDNNTPRTIHGIFALFWPLCECCVGMPYPPIVDPGVTLPPSLKGKGGTADGGPLMEEATAVVEAAMGAVGQFADDRAEALAKATRDLTEQPHPVIAIWQQVRLTKEDSLVEVLASPATVGRYPWLMQGVLSEMDGPKLAARLDMTPEQFAAERRLVDAWLKATVKSILGRQGEP